MRGKICVAVLSFIFEDMLVDAAWWDLCSRCKTSISILKCQKTKKWTKLCFLFGWVMCSHFDKCSPQCLDSDKSVILFKVMMQFNLRERVREGESNNKTKCNVNRIYLICQQFCMIQVRCIFTCNGVPLNTEGNISPNYPLLTILRPEHLFILFKKSNVNFGTLWFISFV